MSSTAMQRERAKWKRLWERTPYPSDENSKALDRYIELAPFQSPRSSRSFMKFFSGRNSYTKSLRWGKRKK